MTEEERAARLAEMSGNASVHEEARWARQKRAREADDSEEAANALQPTGARTVVQHCMLPVAAVSVCCHALHQEP